MLSQRSVRREFGEKGLGSREMSLEKGRDGRGNSLPVCIFHIVQISDVCALVAVTNNRLRNRNTNLLIIILFIETELI